MNEKYTIRDFLVYLTTGSFVLLTLLYHFKNSLFRFFQIDIHSIEKTTTLYVLLLIPGLYLVGHIVQGVDYILLFKVGNYMKKAAKKKNQIISKFFSSWVVATIIKFMLNHRITTQLNRRAIKEREFWQSCFVLIKQSIYEKADYWNLIHTLFEGLTLVSLFWSIYFICILNIPHIFISSFLTAVCWVRTQQMARNFVNTITDYTASVSEKSSAPTLNTDSKQ